MEFREIQIDIFSNKLKNFHFNYIFFQFEFMSERTEIKQSVFLEVLTSYSWILMPNIQILLRLMNTGFVGFANTNLTSDFCFILINLRIKEQVKLSLNLIKRKPFFWWRQSDYNYVYGVCYIKNSKQFLKLSVAKKK